MAQYRFERVQAEYLELWTKMKVLKAAEAKAQAQKVISHKDRYKTVEGKTGVPWFVVGCLHMRESNGNFNTWLHNGDPMKRSGVPVRTVQVPKGRPPNPDVSWEDGAYDALVVIEHLDEIDDWGPEHVAYAAEKFNGFGYRSPSRNIPSPYLWGGTSVQKPGKFVRDGVYDPTVMDSQLGAMAVLRSVMDLDSSARFGVPKPKAKEPPPLPVPVDKPSPKAEDAEQQVPTLEKSKTIWGGIAGYLTTAVTAIGSLFDKLGQNPYAWAFL